MKQTLSLLLLIATLVVTGQDNNQTRDGTISYITTQSIYVKFSSTEHLSKGDTLYINRGDNRIPALQIKNLSSLSCVCIPILKKDYKLADVVYANLGAATLPNTIQEAPATDQFQTTVLQAQDTLSGEIIDEKKSRQEISGRLAISSYSNFSNRESEGHQRMRYSFSMCANNLGNSKLSAESYLSFAHTSSNWKYIKENVFNGLKIYNLSLKYDFNETMHLVLGRKINSNLSSVGAIDGIQFEKKISSITLGAFAGSRPDYNDYIINPDLLQAGVYLAHGYVSRSASIQNSIAFIEQTNNLETDRRFLYFQHTSWLMKNLNFFASAEIDLYRKVGDTKETIFDLTNTYLSVRYRIIHPLSVGLSYSARQNLIYYETYKDFVERLLETETLQGWRFRINYRPIKQMTVGLNAGYRFRKEDPRPSKSIYGYIRHSHIPGIGAAITLSTTWLETSYLNGRIYGLGISRDLIAGKLHGGLKYRYVDYLYQNSESDLIQHVSEASLSWKVYKKLSLSLYYEGTFEKQLPYNRLYINISQRF